MRRLAPLLAVAALLTASPALAADPAGDWVGTLHTPSGVLKLGLEVRRDARGRWQGRYDDISQNYRGIPMRAAGPGAPPPFAVRSPHGVMTYAWNPAAGRWGALWRERGGAYRFALERGTIPPTSGVSPFDRITLSIFGAAMVLEAAAIAWLLRARVRRRRGLGRRRGGRARGGLMLASILLGFGEALDPPSRHVVEAGDDHRDREGEPGEPPL